MLISENILIIVVLILMVLYVRYIWKNRWLYYDGSKFEGPLSWPIIGSAYCFRGGADVILDKIKSFLNGYQAPFVKLWIGNYLVIMPKEPKYVEIILKNHLDKSPLYDALKMGLDNGFVTAPVEIWKRHRKVINQTMNQNILNSFVDIFVKHSNKCVEEFERNCGQIDIFPIVFKCTLNMICETTFHNNNNINHQQHHQQPSDLNEQDTFILHVLRLQNIVILLMFKPWWNWIWKFTYANEFNLEKSEAEEFVKRMIKMKCQENVQSESKKKYFLNYLVNMEYARFTDKEILDETKTMILAGSETTALTEGYVFLMLALHPEIQEKAYKEIFRILGEKGIITYQNLKETEYLSRIIKETLRLFPTLSIVARYLHENIQLDSYVLPKGSTVFILIEYFHKNPQFWPDPLKFDPDRFSPEETAKRPFSSYFPFSIGVRNCIGFQYALMSMKVFLASIIQNFKITTSQYKTVSDIKVEYAITIKPLNGFKINLERR